MIVQRHTIDIKYKDWLENNDRLIEGDDWCVNPDGNIYLHVPVDRDILADFIARLFQTQDS